MNPAWRQFLSAHSAPGGSAPDANPVGSSITDLSHLAVIEISGSDAMTFLHGQLTSDVAGLAVDRAQFSAWCNARGQVVAVVLLLRLSDRYFILLPQEQCATFVRRLGLYVLRADVRISDRSDEWVRIGIVAIPGKTPAIDPDLGAPEPWQIAETQGLTGLRLPDTEGRRRFLICGNIDAAQAFWLRPARRYVAVAPDAWRLHDVLAGIPWLVPELADSYLPQELGLEALGALSLAKGCYPGQEIIARAQYRGRVKRGLFLFTVSTPQPPSPGSSLSAASAATRPAGTVLHAQTQVDGVQTGLAVCELDLAGTVELHVGSPAGPRVVIGKLIK
ncbi:MAG: folate-binding protein YgfZ [Gammaproteobacteria bacterium]|nr:folate-binding protein YgfZ [Gammaproteobacteria bacterium]